MKKFLERAKAWLTGHSGMAFYATVLLVAVLVSLNALVYALTTQYGLYLYSPERESAPVSEASELYFKRAMLGGRQVTVTFCNDESKVKDHDTGSFVYTTAKAMAEKHPDFIKLRFVNAITGYDAEGNYVDLTKYNEEGTLPIYTTSIIFECEGNYRTLTGGATGYEDFYTLTAGGEIYAYNGEEVLASMICWVTESEHKTAYLTQNHGEMADVALNAALVSAGYYVDVINLRKTPVPEDAAMVIISNPAADFEISAEVPGVTAELDRLESYLDRGGNLYVALDPLVKKLPNLEGFLAERGFEIGEITDENGTVIREIVRDDVNGIPPDGYSFVATPADNSAAEPVFALMRDYVDGGILIHASSHLKLSNGALPIITSSTSSVTAAAGGITNSDGGYAIVGYNEIKNRDGSTARILVIPNIYLTSTEPMVNNSYTNKAFVLSVFNVFFDSTATPMGCSSILFDSPVLEDFTMGRARVYTAIILAIPTLLAAIGAAVIIRRKNR